MASPPRTVVEKRVHRAFARLAPASDAERRSALTGSAAVDSPALVEAARAAHPGLVVELHGAIGEDAIVLDAMARAALAATGFMNNPPLP